MKIIPHHDCGPSCPDHLVQVEGREFSCNKIPQLNIEESIKQLQFPFMRALKAAGTPRIRASDIKGKNEPLGEQSLGSGPSVAPKRTLRSTPQLWKLVGRWGHLIPSRRRGGVGAASPAPFFQISRLTPRPSLRSAHSSAGGSASSPRLFFSCSSSSSRAMAGAENANCRQIK